jgi:hypothetical protein
MDYIKSSDIDHERFYKVPKMLFLNKKYKGLSLMAKMAYSVIKDRMELSKRNGYTEPDGRVYAIFKQKDLAEFFGVSLRTIKNIFTELKEAGLLEVQKQGMCRPAKVYLAKVECSSDEEPDFSDEGQNQRIGGANDFTTEVNADSPRRCDEFHPHMSETDMSETDRVNIEEEEEEGWQEVVKCYQNNIRPICGEIERDELLSLYQDYGKEWVIASIHESVKNEVRKRSYMKAVLERWKVDGFGVDNRKKKNPSSQNQIVDTDIDWSKYDG